MHVYALLDMAVFLLKGISISKSYGKVSVYMENVPTLSAKVATKHTIPLKDNI